MIAFKFRLYPSKDQQSKLWRHACKLNWLYNLFLNQKIEIYKKDKTTLSRCDLQEQLVQLKQTDPELKEIHSQVLQQVPFRLDRTYSDFFKRGFGFPNFRSCRNFYSICYPQSGFSIQDNIFKTKIYGEIKFDKHRKIQGNVKTVTIKCEPNGRWFICIVTDFEKSKDSPKGIVGIDVGITNLAALSNGEVIKNKTHAKYFDKIINKIKSRRDKFCQKKSRKFRYLSQVVQRLYGVKNRKISDFQHKLSKSLSCQFDTIVCEDLNLKQMSEGVATGLNRELRNSNLGSFISKLEYKTKELLKVNPKNTTKTCNKCGHIQDMPLSKRIYICPVCGYEENRDVNAARNILCLGQAILSQVCSADASLQEAYCFSCR